MRCVYTFTRTAILLVAAWSPHWPLDSALGRPQSQGTTEAVAVAVFDTGDPETTTWGYDSLPTSLTVDGTTVAASFVYRASSATASTWTATVGPDLAISGSNQTADLPAPLGDTSKTVRLAGTGDYRSATDPGLGTDDFVMRVGHTCNTQAGKYRLIQLYISQGVIVYCEATGQTTFQFFTPSGTYAVTGCPANPGAYRDLIAYANRDGQLATYCNGVVVGNATISAAAADSIVQSISIGGFHPRASGDVMYVGFWHSPGWLTTAIQTTHAREQFSLLSGTRFSGEAATVATRGSTAYLRKCDADTDTIQHFLVGQNWIRREIACGESWADVTGTRMAMLTHEPSVTNLALQSNTLATAPWSAVGATVTADQGVAPDGYTTLERIDGSGTGDHGASQAITLTAATHTLSFFWRAGAQPFGYADVSSIANVWAYYDSSDCQPTSEGSAADAVGYSLGGGLCKGLLRYTGTAASHTHRVLCAEADGDKDYTGATGDCYFGWVNVVAKDHGTTYIPTTTTTATRSADVLRLPVTYAGSALTTVHKVLVAEHNTAGFHYFYDFSDGSTTNRVQSYMNGSDVAGSIGAASGTQWNITGSTDISSGVAHTLRLAAAVNDVTLYVNGSAEGTPDTVATLPVSPSQLDIGIPFGGSSTMAHSTIRLRIFEDKLAPGEQGTGDDT